MSEKLSPKIGMLESRNNQNSCLEWPYHVWHNVSASSVDSRQVDLLVSQPVCDYQWLECRATGSHTVLRAATTMNSMSEMCAKQVIALHIDACYGPRNIGSSRWEKDRESQWQTSKSEKRRPAYWANAFRKQIAGANAPKLCCCTLDKRRRTTCHEACERITVKLSLE